MAKQPKTRVPAAQALAELQVWSQKHDLDPERVPLLEFASEQAGLSWPSQQVLKACLKAGARTLGDLLAQEPAVVDVLAAYETTGGDMGDFVAGLESYLEEVDTSTRRSTGIPRPPLALPALEAWAQQHGVAKKLDAPLKDVIEVPKGQATAFRKVPAKAATLRALLTDPGQGSTFSARLPPEVFHLLQGQARGWLMDRAVHAFIGREKEKARALAWASPVGEPMLARVDAALREARERLRPKVEAPLIPEEVAEFQLVLVEKPAPALAVAAKFNDGEAAWERVKQILLPLLDLGQAPLQPHCSCQREGCEHALFAVELALDSLHEPARDPKFWGAVAKLAGAPSWGRALEALDEGLGTLAPAPAVAKERRLAWRVKPGLAPEVLPVVEHRLKDGSWGAEQSTTARQVLDGAAPASPADERAAEALAGASNFAFSSTDGVFHLRALRHLVGQPNVTLAGEAGRPLHVVQRRLQLQLELGPTGQAVAKVGFAEPQAPQADLLAAVQAAEHGHLTHLDRERSELALCEIPSELVAVAKALSRHGRAFPREAWAGLLERLARVESALPVALPPELQGQRVDPAPAQVVRLQAVGDRLRAEVRARPLARTALVPGEPPGRVGAFVDLSPAPMAPPLLPSGDMAERGGADLPPGSAEAPLPARGGAGAAGAGERSHPERVYADRDLAAERTRAHALVDATALASAEPAGPWAYSLEGEPALDLLAALQEKAGPGLEVEWLDERVQRVGPSVRTKTLKVSVKDNGKDWFGVQGSAEVEGQPVTLQDLLEAVRAGRRYIQVGPDKWAPLEKELRERLTPLADVAAPGPEGIQVSPLAAPAVLDLLDDVGEAQLGVAWQANVQRLRAAQQLDPTLPPGLKADLRPYQREGYRWLMRLAAWGAGACLADDMGLGKTVQSLAALLARASLGPTLVVAPTSLGFNWKREAEKFAPGLRPLLYREAPDRDVVLASLQPGDLLIVSYGLLARDVERLAGRRWATLVLDEAQAIKNANTRRARAVRQLQADWTFALTGTPLENHLGELWSLFRSLTPGLLGSWESFRSRFAAPVETGRDPSRRAALARVVRPFILRRTKAQVATDLPARTEIVRRVVLGPGERRLYDTSRLAAVNQLQGGELAKQPGQGRFQVLAALTRLRQLACHPRLVDPESPVPSAKLAALLELVEELREEGHRALIFSQFVSHLALVRAALDALGVKYQYLDGETPAQERQRRVDAFQAGQGELFLISLKAGGVGLNLTAADYVIHLDPWWNPAVEDQATDRAHRIGQQRPVTVYRLVAQGTIEEAILELHGDKRDLISGLLEGSDRAGALTTEELLALIRTGEGAPQSEAEAEAESEVGEGSEANG